MLKVFATQVVVSKGYDNTPALRFSENGDSVRFRIGKKVYDPHAENDSRLKSCGSSILNILKQ